MPVSSSNVDTAFQKKVEEIGGENFRRCMQCGQCAGICPFIEDMDLSPRQLIHLLQFGQSGMIADSKTFWTCASCHSCMVNCPREIDIPALMEACRLTVLRQNKDRVHPSRVPAETMADMPQIAFVAAFRKLSA